MMITNEAQASVDDVFARLAQLEAEAETTRRLVDDAPHTHIDALTALGQAYLETGNTPKALTQFEEALDVAEAADDSTAQARLWGFKGMCLLRLGNANFAQRALFRALNLAKETNQTALIIDTLIRIGDLHAKTGQQTKAISRLEQAFGIAMQAGEHNRQMLVAGQLGELFLAMEAHDKAIEYFASAQETAETVDNPRAAAAFQVSIGNALLGEDNGEAAAQQFEAALETADGLEDNVTQMRALNGLLRTQIAAEKVSMAVLYADRLVQLAQEIADPLAEINNLNLLIAFLLQQGQVKKAIPYLNRGIEIARAQEDWAWQLSMLTNLGFAQHQLEALSPALDAYTEARRWAEQLQDQPALAQLQGRIGAVLADMGDTEAGIAAVQRALTLATELEDPSLIGEQQILLAFLYHDQGDRTRALDYCRQAAATFAATGDEIFAAQAEALMVELGV
ncbi:MAG: tetratricopeptide repeat protein [Caldilineaceae bacterium]